SLPSGITTMGMTFNTVSNAMVHHNRFSNPGMVTSGPWYGIYAQNLKNSQILYNDFYSTGAASTSDLMLDAASSGDQVKHNILVTSSATTGDYAIGVLDAASETGFVAD